MSSKPTLWFLGIFVTARLGRPIPADRVVAERLATRLAGRLAIHVWPYTPGRTSRRQLCRAI